MFLHPLDTENYFIVCENNYGHRNNCFQKYGNSERHSATCFVNHLPVICPILHLISCHCQLLSTISRFGKVNQVGLLGGLDSAFDLIRKTHAAASINLPFM